MKILTLLAILIGFNAHAAIEGKLLLNGKEVRSLKPGEPTNIEVFFVDTETGKQVSDLKRMHAKYMHMVAIKKDLSFFRHIHPFLDEVSGRFMLAVNLPNGDFDNSDAIDTFTLPGTYWLYVEVEFKNIGMRKFRWEIEVEGENVFSPLPLDTIFKPGLIHKYFNADGASSVHGAPYEALTSIKTVPGCGGNMVNFQIDFKQFDEYLGYRQLQNVKRWLMMGGHAILMNVDGDPINAHLHAFLPENDDPFEFNYFDRGEMKTGPYVMWVQINHDHQLLSVPFSFHYQAPKELGTTCN